MYTLQTRTDIYTSDVTITDRNFSGFVAQNTGANDAEVLGLTLKSGEKLDMTTACPPGTLWTSPIQVKASGTTVVLVRVIYNKQ